MPDTTQPTNEFELDEGNTIRLTAMLMYIEDTHKEDIVQSWAEKVLDQLNEQTTITTQQVEAFDDDVRRIDTQPTSDDTDTEATAD